MLSKFAYQNQPRRFKDMHYYPPFSEDSFINGTLRQMPASKFVIFNGKIETSTAKISAMGLERQGLNTITISASESSATNSGINIQSILFRPSRAYESVDSLEIIQSGFRTGRTKVEVREGNGLMELSFWNPKRKRGEGLRWVFDLRKQGFVIYHENTLIPRESYFDETIYTKEFGANWFPRTAKERIVNLKTGKHLEYCECTFFQVKLGKEAAINDDTFSIQNLPLKKVGVYVKDRRLGKGNSVTLDEFIKQQRLANERGGK